MSLYDQLVLSGSPTLYLSSPSLTDQSGHSVSLTLSAGLNGQPIIYGHLSSFLINDTDTITINTNPGIFIENKSIEFVCHLFKPSNEFPLFIDNNGNGIYITENSIKLRLYFSISGTINPITIEIPVVKWDRKFYISMTFSSNQASLKVNSVTNTLPFIGTPVDSVTGCTISTSSNEMAFIDGIASYYGPFIDKLYSINDPGSDYDIYSSTIYKGMSTFFTGYKNGFNIELKSTDFTYDQGSETYNYLFQIPKSMFEYTLLMFYMDNDNISMQYQIDQTPAVSFLSKTSVAPIVNPEYILLTYNLDLSQSQFSIKIIGITDPSIVQQTPAVMSLTGAAILPIQKEQSMVNDSSGLYLNQGVYMGTWNTGINNSAPPKTIEIVFKPQDISNGAYVFSSSDGHARYGSSTEITGFTGYLNGVLVTDLSGIKLNQWNHLVLTKSSTAAISFLLNDDASDHSHFNLSYLLLTSYQQQLTLADVQDLYNILLGADDITVDEDPLDLIEGSYTDGNPYKIYSYSWAIVSGGGK